MIRPNRDARDVRDTFITSLYYAYTLYVVAKGNIKRVYTDVPNVPGVPAVGSKKGVRVPTAENLPVGMYLPNKTPLDLNSKEAPSNQQVMPVSVQALKKNASILPAIHPPSVWRYPANAPR